MALFSHSRGDAVTHFKESVSDVRSWLQRGLLAGRSADYSEARRCFQAARDLDPDNVVALLWLAWLAPSRRVSLALFCRVLELDPRNKRAQAGIDWVRGRPHSGYPEAKAGAYTDEGKIDQARLLTPVVYRPGWAQTMMGVVAFLTQRLAFGALVLIAIIFLSHLGFALARGLTAYSAASSCRPMSAGSLWLRSCHSIQP